MHMTLCSIMHAIIIIPSYIGFLFSCPHHTLTTERNITGKGRQLIATLPLGKSRQTITYSSALTCCSSSIFFSALVIHS